MRKNHLILFALIVCFSFFFHINLGKTVILAADIYKNGKGYNTKEWKNSETIAFLKQIPNDRKIYSNGYDIVSFMTEKKVKTIPREVNPNTSLPNQDFAKELEGMCINIGKGDLFVYFFKINWRWYFPTLDEIEKNCKLTVIQHFSDGIIYGSK